MAGLVPGRDIEVEFTGRRPGERLHEMLSVVPLIPSQHPRISVADQGFPAPVTLFDKMRALIRLASLGDGVTLRENLLAVAQSSWSNNVVELQNGADISIDLREEGELSESALGWQNELEAPVGVSHDELGGAAG
jgi:hypothetical protein